MSRLQYRLALVLVYAVFGAFVLLCLAIVASVTVLPMYENYRDHGSVFLSTPEAEIVRGEMM